MVGPTEQVEKDPFRVTSEITLTLGDKVTIETYGLSGHVNGSITERTQPGEPTRATGELQVKDGQYTALARKLDIERGRLIFSGGLLVDPAVDIRAVKEFPDVKAGVNVRGTLREPRLSFFSEPSIPQSQIVSLLLAGGSLQSAQDQDRAGTPGATQEVAGQAAALLVSQLGSKLGIPDISVESDLSNETSLVLGKYLSPRLYVSWGVSLTEAINTFKMRYTIDDRWTVKTEAGKESSADLVYHHREMNTLELFGGGTAATGGAGRRHLAAARASPIRAGSCRSSSASRAVAPFRHLVTPGGQTMSVAMTNCGPLGWVSDRSGYRYDARDPLSGQCLAADAR